VDGCMPMFHIILLITPLFYYNIINKNITFLYDYFVALRNAILLAAIPFIRPTIP
jgi:hypothetical protein